MPVLIVKVTLGTMWTCCLNIFERFLNCQFILLSDEDAEEIDSNNPFALDQPQNEDLYIDDPKKSLKGYFEREGKFLGLNKCFLRK